MKSIKTLLLVLAIGFLLQSCATSGNCGGGRNNWAATCPAYR